MARGGNKARGPEKDDSPFYPGRQDGDSRAKVERTASTGRSGRGRRQGRSASYEDWNCSELYERARQIGIVGRSRMSKKELIDALRRP